MTELDDSRREPIVSHPLLNDISSEEQMKIAASDLINISNANQQLVRLGKCLQETQQSSTAARYSMLTLEICAQINIELEKERKSHAEELRLINQDINHLEDILKRVESDHRHHRSQLAQKMIHLKVDFQSFQNLTNNLLDEHSLQPSEAQIDITNLETNENDDSFENSQLTWEEFMPEIPCSTFTFETSAVPIFQDRPNYICTCHTITAGFVGFVREDGLYINASSRGIGQPSHSAKAFTFNHTTGLIGGNAEKLTSSFKEESTKMKSCLNCEQKIHRNAPVCPFCKAKITSRANKRTKAKS
uniref:C4H2-type domain-containing protein n=1 Tax=Ditylenchus dipsaci TaxID=166011 RepID=A0A915EJF0_9BILA